MKRHVVLHVGRQSWGFAALFLIAFCWLGFVAARFGALCQGFVLDLPATKRFVVAYGPIAFPLFGIVAATAFILPDVFFRNRRGQWALVAAFALLIMWALSMVFSGLVMPTSTLPAPSPPPRGADYRNAQNL
jgi:hypothetical protein